MTSRSNCLSDLATADAKEIFANFVNRREVFLHGESSGAGHHGARIGGLPWHVAISSTEHTTL